MNVVATTPDSRIPTGLPVLTGSRPSRGMSVLSWVLQIAIAAMLFQTLFFKFTAAEESVYIFTRLGMEPWGRIASGVVELAACVLLLVPRAAAWGALLALAVISGAVVSHLTKLGIVVKDDGGLLFALALMVMAGSIAVLYIRRGQLLPRIGGILGKRGGYA